MLTRLIRLIQNLIDENDQTCAWTGLKKENTLQLKEKTKKDNVTDKLNVLHSYMKAYTSKTS